MAFFGFGRSAKPQSPSARAVLRGATVIADNAEFFNKHGAAALGDVPATPDEEYESRLRSYIETSGALEHLGAQCEKVRCTRCEDFGSSRFGCILPGPCLPVRAWDSVQKNRKERRERRAAPSHRNEAQHRSL